MFLMCFYPLAYNDSGHIKKSIFVGTPFVEIFSYSYVFKAVLTENCSYFAFFTSTKLVSI